MVRRGPTTSPQPFVRAPNLAPTPGFSRRSWRPTEMPLQGLSRWPGVFRLIAEWTPLDHRAVELGPFQRHARPGCPLSCLVDRFKPCANPHDTDDLPRYLPPGPTSYVLYKFTTKSYVLYKFDILPRGRTWSRRFSDTLFSVGAYLWQMTSDRLWWLGNISVHSPSSSKYMMLPERPRVCHSRSVSNQALHGSWRGPCLVMSASSPRRLSHVRYCVQRRRVPRSRNIWLYGAWPRPCN